MLHGTHGSIAALPLFIFYLTIGLHCKEWENVLVETIEALLSLMEKTSADEDNKRSLARLLVVFLCTDRLAQANVNHL